MKRHIDAPFVRIAHWLQAAMKTRTKAFIIVGASVAVIIGALVGIKALQFGTIGSRGRAQC